MVLLVKVGEEEEKVEVEKGHHHHVEDHQEAKECQCHQTCPHQIQKVWQLCQVREALN
jgi:hypothetical protein